MNYAHLANSWALMDDNIRKWRPRRHSPNLPRSRALCKHLEREEREVGCMVAFSFDVCGRRAAAARRVDGLGQAAAGPQQDPETRHFRRFAIGLAMRQTWPGRSRQSAAAKRRRPTSFSAVRVQSALCPRFQQLLPPFRVPLRAARRAPGQARPAGTGDRACLVAAGHSYGPAGCWRRREPR